MENELSEGMGKTNVLCQLEWPLQSEKEVGKIISENLVKAYYQTDAPSGL